MRLLHGSVWVKCNWETIFYGHHRSIFNHCDVIGLQSYQIGWMEFNVSFQHKYGYIRDERSGVESYPLTQ